MDNLPSHLTPRSTRTASRIYFSGFYRTGEGAAAVMEFKIIGTDGEGAGIIEIPVGPTEKATIDSMVVEGHNQMIQIVRSWLLELDQMRTNYQR